jgi:hypothetical protein
MAPPAAANSTDSNHHVTTAAVTKVSDSPALLIKKLSEKARLPTRGSEFAAGYDIYASKEMVIPARGKALVDTDISMAVPAGTCKFSLSFSSQNLRDFFLSFIIFYTYSHCISCMQF